MLSDRVLLAAEIRARRVGRSIVRTVVGAVFATLAFAFLTAALWLALAEAFGAVAACAATGLGYGFLALLIFVVSPRPPAPPPPTRLGLDDLVHAFVMASRIGRSARRR
jgi:hypothetical protein